MSRNSYRSPGQAHRNGLTLIEMFDMFPTEAAATAWFESVVWPSGRCCGHCGSTRTSETPNARPMPYWCSDCRSYFSVRTGTALARSKVPLRKWAVAVYICVTSLKSVSSMKLHRDIGVSQKTAWFMLHRLREAYTSHGADPFSGPVEVDETYVGGLERNKHEGKKLKAGRGPVGKTPVVGIRDRATHRVAAHVVESVDGATLGAIVRHHTAPGATVYTDDHGGYAGISEDYDHETVRHSVGEYVRQMAHTNGIESFWATLKRAHKGYLPQAERKAPAAVRERVRREAEHPPDGHDRPDAPRRGRTGRPPPHVPRPHPLASPPLLRDGAVHKMRWGD